MKKIILMLAVVGFISFAFAREIRNPVSGTHTNMVTGKKITLINDTAKKVKVHTGSGSVSLNPRGGKTSFTCKPGKSVKVDGKVAFKVTDKMCGKTIKLSEYL